MGVMLKFFWKQIVAFTQNLKKYDVSSYAASAAFFFILSFVPIVLLVCAVIPYTDIRIDYIHDMIKDLLPDYMLELFSSIINEFSSTRITLISISALITLWASGKGIFALMRGLNAIHEVNEKRNFIVLRILACCYLAVLLALILLSLIFLVFGNRLTDIILHRIPELKFLYAFILHFRFLFFWVFYMVLFLFFYILLPNKKMRLREQIPGALIASICWTLFSWGFSLYVDVFGGFSMYGSLTTIIVTMFWLYFCMYIVLMGAIANKRYFLMKEEFLEIRKTDKEKKAGKVKRTPKKTNLQEDETERFDYDSKI